MKKLLKVLLISAVLCASIFALTGCGIDLNNNTSSRKNKNEDKNENNTSVNTTSNNTNSETNSTTNSAVNNTTTEKKTAKEVDKTPVDIKDEKSYFFIINGKKYSAGDKISSLSDSGFHLNKAGSEKELQANGYLIGGDAILNSENKTVFYSTPFNGTKEKITGAEASIGGFSIDDSMYERFPGDIEIVNGITIGTSIDDIKTIFGEPTSKTEATEYNGPTYTYSVSGEYKSFTFRFDKEGKLSSIRWQAFIRQ